MKSQNKLVIHIIELLRKIRMLLLIMFISALVITILIILVYRPVLEVHYKGKFVGYIENIFTNEEEVYEELLKSSEGVSYYELEEPIKLEFKFLKRKNINTYDAIKELKAEAIPSYKYYVIQKDGYEIAYLDTYQNAVKSLNKLKENNIDITKYTIELEYVKDKKELANAEEILNILKGNSTEKVKEKNKDNTQKEKQNEIHLTTKAKGALTSFHQITTGKLNIVTQFSVPVSGHITSEFQKNRRILGRTSPHTGLDIGKPTGTPVKAAAYGMVMNAGYYGAYGNMVEIYHGNGETTLYAHLSKINVSVGQIVDVNKTIGLLGSTGRSTGSHLHFEIRKNGVATNPRYYLKF